MYNNYSIRKRWCKECFVELKRRIQNGYYHDRFRTYRCAVWTFQIRTVVDKGLRERMKAARFFRSVPLFGYYSLNGATFHDRVTDQRRNFFMLSNVIG